MWNLLLERFDRNESDTIRDIYDGAEYKRHGDLMSRANPANVSLMCNSDGVEVFKSSKFSIWPLWVVINELPPMERYARILQLFIMQALPRQQSLPPCII